MNAKEAVRRAAELRKCIPAFNAPYLPMIKPMAEAIRDENSVAMIQISRVDYEKLGAVSPERTAEEYAKWATPHTLLHLDHIPVIDEDGRRVDFMPIIERAIRAGFQSVMIDGSRLSLPENIAAVAEVANFVHESNVPCEAELGAVMGHEAVVPPYEEIFDKKMGFTKLDEAARFARESGCDWLSIAAGNIHGAIAEAVRDQKKPEARLDVEHIANLAKAAAIPLVLHGGSGIQHQCLLDAIDAGIAKINVGTELRQTYEIALKSHNGDIPPAQEALYKRTREYIRDFLYNTNLKDKM